MLVLGCEPIVGPIGTAHRGSRELVSRSSLSFAMLSENEVSLSVCGVSHVVGMLSGE